MQKVIFVIGANAAGKTYFIEHHLASEKAVVLNIYDYQQMIAFSYLHITWTNRDFLISFYRN